MKIERETSNSLRTRRSEWLAWKARKGGSKKLHKESKTKHIRRKTSQLRYDIRLYIKCV